ncbi:hypothetical protein [Pectinatus brassicae]|uniref:Uncharacterized protein n=1 Tax=Pectinatus brassicae TaxID=862415 RepID=A0A840ULV0_9FIRM|nr:hypothetical protein [Pectinatus brassicae]MBB5337170.1 hypothetical protein [Pectinatus brassicae]
MEKLLYNNLLRLRNHYLLLNSIEIVIAIIIFEAIKITEISLHYRQIGKFIGNIAVILGVGCLIYYVARELYIYIKKKNIKIPMNNEIFPKKLILYSGLLHPVLGISMFYVVLLHAGFMITGGIKHYNFSIIAGIMAGISLLIMLILGMNINKYKWMRKYHRRFAYILIFFYIVHML